MVTDYSFTTLAWKKIQKQHSHLQQQERPYHADRTTSRPLCEVKRRRARLVLRWGTTWEALVLFLFTYTILYTIVGREALGGALPFLIPCSFFVQALFTSPTATSRTRLDYRPQDTCSSSSLDTPSCSLPPSLPPSLLAFHTLQHSTALHLFASSALHLHFLD